MPTVYVEILTVLARAKMPKFETQIIVACFKIKRENIFINNWELYVQYNTQHRESILVVFL